MSQRAENHHDALTFPIRIEIHAIAAITYNLIAFIDIEGYEF